MHARLNCHGQAFSEWRTVSSSCDIDDDDLVAIAIRVMLEVLLCCKGRIVSSKKLSCWEGKHCGSKLYLMVLLAQEVCTQYFFQPPSTDLLVHLRKDGSCICCYPSPCALDHGRTSGAPPRLFQPSQPKVRSTLSPRKEAFWDRALFEVAAVDRVSC